MALGNLALAHGSAPVSSNLRMTLKITQSVVFHFKHQNPIDPIAVLNNKNKFV